MSIMIVMFGKSYYAFESYLLRKIVPNEMSDDNEKVYYSLVLEDGSIIPTTNSFEELLLQWKTCKHEDYYGVNTDAPPAPTLETLKVPKPPDPAKLGEKPEPSQQVEKLNMEDHIKFVPSWT